MIKLLLCHFDLPIQIHVFRVCLNSVCKVLYEYTTVITLLLVSKAKTVLAKQLCCIQTRMYKLCRKMAINGHVLHNLYIFVWVLHLFGSIFKLCYIQNHVRMNPVKKKFLRICSPVMIITILYFFYYLFIFC